MKIAALVRITDGPSHTELTEDRCENLMDQRSRWNVSLQIENEEKCVAAEIVNRITPEDKIFLPKRIKRFRGIKRQRGRRKEWKRFIGVLSRSELKEISSNCTTWRLGGRAHFWPEIKDAIVFEEYDAAERIGYALIIVDVMKLAFVRGVIQAFVVTDDDIQILCDKW